MRLQYIFFSVILIVILATGCAPEGPGISNFELAGTNNPAAVHLTVSYNGNATVDASSPLVVSLYTNVSGSYPHTNGVYTQYSLTVKQSIITMNNVYYSPLYIIGHLDSSSINNKIDSGEQFLGYSDGLSLDTPNTVQVYGGQTNDLSLTFNDLYRFSEATLELTVNYTGTHAFTNGNKVFVTIATGTNDFINAGFSNISEATNLFTTNIYRITATNLYIAGFVDTNGNSTPDAGETVYVYNGTAAWSNAAALSVSTNPSSSTKLTVTFGDTYTNFITNL